MKERREWSAEFNALPFETRTIACAVSNERQISFLRRERERLTKMYKQSLKEIDDHIERLERWYAEEFAREEK